MDFMSKDNSDISTGKMVLIHNKYDVTTEKC